MISRIHYSRIHYYGAVLAFMCGMSFEMLHAAHETPQSYLDLLDEALDGAHGGAGQCPLAGRKRKRDRVYDSRETVMWAPVVVPFMRESNELGVGLSRGQLLAHAQSLTSIVFDAAEEGRFNCELLIAGFEQNLSYVQELIDASSSDVAQRTFTSFICLNNLLCLFYAQLTPEKFEDIFHPLGTYGRARHKLFVGIIGSIQRFVSCSSHYHTLGMELAPLKCPYHKGFEGYAEVAETAGAASLPVRPSKESVGIFTVIHGALPASFSWDGHAYPIVPGEFSDAKSFYKLHEKYRPVAVAPALPAGRLRSVKDFRGPIGASSAATVVASPYDGALESPASGSAFTALTAESLHGLARMSPSSPAGCAAAVAAAVGSCEPKVVVPGGSAGMSTPMGHAPAVPLQCAPARMTPRTRAAQKAEQAAVRREPLASVHALDARDDRFFGDHTPVNQAPAVPLGWAPLKREPSPLVPLTMLVGLPVPPAGGEGRSSSVAPRLASVFRVIKFDGSQGLVPTVDSADAADALRALARSVARRAVLPQGTDDVLPESSDSGTASDEDSD